MSITETEYQAMRQRAPIVRLNDTLEQLKPAKAKSKQQIALKESEVLNACIKILYAWRCDVMRCNTGSAWREYTNKYGAKKRYYITFGKTGMGDILALSPFGRWIEVETKSTIGELDEAQIRRRGEVERRNGVYVIARCLEDMEKRKADILAENWA